jgi:aspartyl-tRNA(Asn)/glutamyl-tRNA(Gln) amidotransferase subunit C
MPLEVDEVRKLARLARLDLTEAEVETLGPQLEKILGFVEQLSELDTDDVEPMATALDVDNRWRPDIVAPGLSVDEALASAPSRDGGYFLVPPVLGPSSAKSSKK